MTDDPETLLATPLGIPGSGRVRYGAAMALYRAGRMGEAELEVWRIASARDAEDAQALMAERGLAGHLRPPVRPGPAQAAALLVAEAGRYLSGLPGPGVAEVRAGLVRATPQSPPAPQPHPVVDRWLDVALDALTPTHPALARAIATLSPHLAWGAYDRYPIDQIGQGFAAGNAFASVVGASGLLGAGDYDFGLFLLAPQVLYRDHCHPAPELYAPLTGPHGWRFGAGRPLVLKPAHVPVWNDPLRPHLTKVGPVPFLCLYGWTRDVDQPARVIPADDWRALEARHL